MANSVMTSLSNRTRFKGIMNLRELKVLASELTDNLFLNKAILRDLLLGNTRETAYERTIHRLLTENEELERALKGKYEEYEDVIGRNLIEELITTEQERKHDELVGFMEERVDDLEYCNRRRDKALTMKTQTHEELLEDNDVISKSKNCILVPPHMLSIELHNEIQDFKEIYRECLDRFSMQTAVKKKKQQALLILYQEYSKAIQELHSETEHSVIASSSKLPTASEYTNKVDALLSGSGNKYSLSTSSEEDEETGTPKSAAVQGLEKSIFSFRVGALRLRSEFDSTINELANILVKNQEILSKNKILATRYRNILNEGSTQDTKSNSYHYPANIPGSYKLNINETIM